MGYIYTRSTSEAIELCYISTGYTDRWTILIQRLHVKLWRCVTLCTGYTDSWTILIVS